MILTSVPGHPSIPSSLSGCLGYVPSSYPPFIPTEKLRKLFEGNFVGALTLSGEPFLNTSVRDSTVGPLRRHVLLTRRLLLLLLLFFFKETNNKMVTINQMQIWLYVMFFSCFGIEEKIGSCIFLNMRDSDGLDSRYGSVHYDRSLFIFRNSST